MRIKVVSLMAIAAAILSSPAFGQAAKQRKKTLFEKAADLFTPRPVAPAPRALAAPRRAANPPNPANARISGERRTRLGKYSAAAIAWADSVCDLSDEQRTKARGILEVQAEANQKAWLKAPNRGAQNGNRDFGPYEFGTVTRKLQLGPDKKGLGDVLNKAQVIALEEAIKERDESLARGLVGHAVLVLDREMFLTPALRKPVADELRAMFGKKLYLGLFGFQANSWPFKREQFLVRAGLKAVVGDVRYRRYERLTKQNGQAEQYVMVSMGPDSDGEETIRKAVAEQPKRVAEAMAIRILYLQETEGLTKAQARKLTIAAKGAAAREIDKWVDSSEKQLQSMRQQFVNQNVSWGLSLLQISQVERNQLWAKTKAQVLAGDTGPAKQSDLDTDVAKAKSQIATAITNMFATKRPAAKTIEDLTERDRYQRATMVNYLVAVIDQEIWLRPEQRPKLHALIDEAISDYEKYMRYSNYYTELQMLASALHEVKEPAVAELLNEHQLAAWKQVKGQFKIQQNTVHMAYRHGDLQFPHVTKARRR